ncbi:hypothetical protein [Streptomyces sp. WM6378]|uniref:hypothetical protein n=1 Tax=Streptomyces sp. WM6378 TaxID=1415557 RepID=UPI00131C1480|nr:hypothetical protein [Streptomyces sp. WM6378]
MDQIKRPIDQYLVTPHEVATLQAAANILNEKCMREFKLPAVATDLLGFDDKSLRYDKSHSPLYGFFDPATAAVSGYDRVPPQPASGQPAAAPTSADVMVVEHGKDTSGRQVSTYAGKAVPAEGCKGQSVRATGGALPLPDPKALPDHGPQIPTDDPRLVTAYAAWSACMKSEGYDYSTPQEVLANTSLIPKRIEQDGVITFQHTPAELNRHRPTSRARYRPKCLGSPSYCSSPTTVGTSRAMSMF